jgi:hypothetical protein
VEIAPLAAGWRRYESRDEAFAIEWPGEPRREAQSGEEQGAMWSLMGPAGTPSFAVTVYSLPDAQRAENGVAILADTMTSSMPGATARPSETMAHGLSARAIGVENGKLRGHFRVLSAGRRLYRLAVLCEGRAPHADDVRRFFDSFEPLDQATAAPAPPPR